MAEPTAQVAADADTLRASPDHASRPMRGIGALPLLRRLPGAALIALTLLSLWRLLDPERTGLAGAATLHPYEQGMRLLWGGTNPSTVSP